MAPKIFAGKTFFCARCRERDPGSDYRMKAQKRDAMMAAQSALNPTSEVGKSRNCIRKPAKEQSS
jgi:hypothetical protein